MARTKLTERAIEKLVAPEPSGRQVLHWDTELKGFGVLVSGKTTAKTYVVQRDINGKTRRVTIAATNVLKLDLARKRAEEVLADFYKGVDPKAASHRGATLRAVLDDYLAARKDLGERSRVNYRVAVERYLAPWLEMPLCDITPDMVEQRHRAIAADIETGRRTAALESAERYRDKAAKAEAKGWPDAAKRYLAEAAAAAERNPASGHATANAVMRTLRLLWNFAAERAPDLPATPVRRLRRQWFAVPRRERHVAAKELPAFYSGVLALPNPVHRAYLLLLLFTGLRRREAAGLKWGDIDFDERVIRIPAERTKAKRKLDLPMTDYVNDLLFKHRKIGEAEFVFTSDAKSRHIEEPRFPLDMVADATGIRVSAHDLRRTFITAAESADISPLALKALVNHALGGDVTSGYVQMSVERLREPAQKVADRLKRLCDIGNSFSAEIIKFGNKRKSKVS